MGQVVVLPLLFNQSMPCPLPPHSRLDPAGLQKIEVASFGYSQLQTQAVHAGTQDMACSWTGVAFLDLISIGRFQSSHSPPSSILRSDGGIGRVFCGDQRGFLGAWRFSFASSRRIASFGNRQQDNPKSGPPPLSQPPEANMTDLKSLNIIDCTLSSQ